MSAVSVKSIYALRAILDIAYAETMADDRPQQSKVIAERCDIPIKYLEQILVELKQSGLVKSSRGAQGGYRLAKQPAQISALDVILAVDGPVTFTDSVERFAVLDKFWQDATDEMNQHLDQPLDSLLKDHQRQQNLLMYTI